MDHWKTVFVMPLPDGKRIEVRVAGGQVAIGDIKAALGILCETAFLLSEIEWAESHIPPSPISND